jgi:hypothetical protein
VNVKFCRGCRALILSDFRFCPYCGAEAPRGPGIEEALERPFRQLCEARFRTSSDIFAATEKSLECLASEMDQLLEMLAKEGRAEGT